MVSRQTRRPIRGGRGGARPNPSSGLRAFDMASDGEGDGNATRVRLHLASLRRRPDGGLFEGTTDPRRVPARADRDRHPAYAYGIGLRETAALAARRSLPQER